MLKRIKQKLQRRNPWIDFLSNIFIIAEIMVLGMTTMMMIGTTTMMIGALAALLAITIILAQVDHIWIVLAVIATIVLPEQPHPTPINI